MGKLERPDPIYFHFRHSNGESGYEAAGGATVVFVPSKMMFGISLCCPRDKFCKKIGRTVALSRLNSPRSRMGRFHHTQKYTGECEYSDVRDAAMKFALESASKLGYNKYVWASKQKRT